jgi:HSP20 family protein
MPLIKFNPFFGELAATKDRLNRLFGRDDVWDTEGLTTAGEWAPTVDIVENEHVITIKAELPGIEAKDIAVTLDNNVLTLKGERRTEKEVKKENYHRMERAYGTFARAFAFPDYVDTTNVKADFKNGLLTLTLPKKEGARSRAVEVNAA